MNSVHRRSLQLSNEQCIVAGVLLLSLGLRIMWLHLPIHPDEGEAGYNAMLWSRGDVPYVSRPMDKPPLMYFMYLLPISLLGNSIIPVRLLNDILFILSALTLYLIARDWYNRRVALAALVFYGVFMSVPAIEGPFAQASSLSLPFVIFSMYFFARFVRNGSRAHLFYSGLSASMASLVYQQGAVVVILLIVLSTFAGCRLHRQDSKPKLPILRELMGMVLPMTVGFALPMLAFLAYFSVHNGLHDLIRCTVVKFLGSDVAVARSQELSFDWTFLTIIEALPLLALAVYGFIMCVQRRSERYLWLIGWALISSILLCVQARYFGHYFQILVPPASILSGIAIDSVINAVGTKMPKHRAKAAADIAVSAIAILGFIASIYFQARQYPNFAIRWEQDFAHRIQAEVSWNPSAFNYDDQMRLAHYLDEIHIKDGELLAHGWMPSAYWLTGAKAPSVHLCTVREWSPLTEEEYERLLQMVKQRSFKCVVLQHEIPPGDPIAACTLTTYTYVGTIGDVDIFTDYPRVGGATID